MYGLTDSKGWRLAYRLPKSGSLARRSLSRPIYPKLEVRVGAIKIEWWTHTVAKKGPEKNPNRLTATASVMIFGTLVNHRY